MSNIYVSCAGSTEVNGLYTPIVGGYQNSSNSSITLTVDGNYWKFIDNSYSVGLVLYRLYQATITDPLSLTAWEVVGGIAPTPKTALGSYASCSSEGGGGASAGSYTLYRQNNTNYIYKNNNTFYIRKN